MSPRTHHRSLGRARTRVVLATRCGIHPAMISTHRPAPGLRVDLRYEAGGGAGWARVWGQRIGDVFTVSAAAGQAQTLTVPDKYATGVRLRTPMVATDSPETLRICARLGPDRRRQCFWAADGTPSS
ncbi:DUF2690 domain-containing protein [Streptomyces microflavus]|uniref:DUF2690 domain-containing protein n=1 Tax=Streptomyces microflavus TaxID=1919 RepID=UPI0033267205